MKRLLFFALLPLLCGCPSGVTVPPAAAQTIENQPIASQYGQFQLQGTQTNTFVFSPNACQVSAGGTNFAAVTQGVPVRIVDPGNHALDETLTAGLVNINACSVQLSPTNVHVPPFYLTSGTGGLQEALNANATAGAANTIVLDSQWYAQGGSLAIIESVKGSTALGLVDITTTPYTWYQWGGSAYAKVSVGGGSPSGSAGAIQYNNAGNFGGASITGLVKANGSSAPTAVSPTTCGAGVAATGIDINGNSTGCFTPAGGIASINGDTTAAQILTGTGGISCSTVSGTTTCNYSGSAGSGTVGTGGPYNDGGYTPSSPGTSIQPEVNSYTLPLNLSGTAIGTAMASNTGVRIQAGDAHTPFINGSSTKPNAFVDDERIDIPATAISLKHLGAQCDTEQATATLGISSIVFTSNAGISQGMTVAVVGTYLGIPTVYEGILGTNSGTTWNISHNPGMTTGQEVVTVGHDDTAAITQALEMTGVGRTGNYVISVPSGNCLTHVQTHTPQTIIGLSPSQSRITSFPGEAIFAGGGGQNQRMSNLSLQVDSEIDPTQAWQYIDSNGNVNSVAAAYQPILVHTGYSDNPLAPGWFTGSSGNSGGAINGAASVTNGSPTITVTAGTPPTVGQQIIFPYGASQAIFSATVSSVSGSTVGLSANYPGTTASGVEFFAGTSAQNITTAITSSQTMPFTVDVANPLIPVPGYESNVAGFGVVKIDGEEFSYQGVTRSATSTNAITLTARGLNGTTAANHSTGAVVFPLNRFTYDAMPWPVAQTGSPTVQIPANAEFYPGYNVGNFAVGTPWPNGNVGSVSGPLENVFDNLFITPWPLNDIGNGNIAAFYFVGQPYSTFFHDLNLYANYCFVEGQPSINTGDGSIASADGNVIDSVSCHAGEFGVVASVISGNNDTFVGWNTYGGGNGSTPSGAGFNLSGQWNDQTGAGIGGPVTDFISKIYNEPGHTTVGTTGMEADCSGCSWNDLEYSGGGSVLIGGNYNKFDNSNINGTIVYPTINYASHTTFTNNTRVASAPYSVTYGVVPGNTPGGGIFLNYGSSLSGCAPVIGNTGPCIPPGVGNQRAFDTGQTAETFATGNITAPYVSAIGGFITPEEFNTSTGLEVQPMSVGWTYDSTAPITNSYTACNFASVARCFTSAFDTLGGISIGPGQRIAAGYYTPTISVKSPSGSGTFRFGFFAAECGNPLFYSQTVSVTPSWQTLTLPTVNLASYSGCILGMNFSNSTVSGLIETSFVDLQPVAQNLTAQQVTTTGSGTVATIFSGSGAPTGCGSTYANGSLYLNTAGSTGSMLYTCIGTTWTDIK